MYRIELYQAEKQAEILDFLDRVYGELNWKFDLHGKHKVYINIEDNFERFWCLFDDDTLIGTVALRKMSDSDYELKTLYLYKAYHGKKLGYMLIKTAIDHARNNSYRRIYLDTVSTSESALRLYRRNGFCDTERYNDNPVADVFMVLEL